MPNITAAELHALRDAANAQNNTQNQQAQVQPQRLNPDSSAFASAAKDLINKQEKQIESRRISDTSAHAQAQKDNYVMSNPLLHQWKAQQRGLKADGSAHGQAAKDDYADKNPLFHVWRENYLANRENERANLQKKLDELDANRAYVTTTEQSDALEKRRAVFGQQLAALGGTEKKPSAWERIKDTVGGTFEQRLGSDVGTMRALYESGQNSRTAEYQREMADLEPQIERARVAYEEMRAQYGEEGATVELNILQDLQRKYAAYKQVVDQNIQQRATAATSDMSNRLSELGANKLENAKEGLGFAGRVAVDIGSGAVNLLTDAALGRVGGAALSNAALGFRGFGSTVQAAEAEGAGIGTQITAGTVEAAKEILMGKMFDGLAGAYGKGAADDIIESAVDRLAATDTGRNALRALFKSTGEGAEEFIESKLDPLVSAIYDHGKALNQKYGSGWQGYKEAAVDDLYSGLIGFALGAGGQVVDAGRGDYKKANAELDAGRAVTEQNNTAPRQEAEKKHISMADFTDNSSQIWDNLDYNDTAAQTKAMQDAHNRMISEGRVVEIPESTQQRTAEAFPDLRSMKKSERTPILKQKIAELKGTLRQFLNSLKNGSFEFEVNGNVLEAKLYDTGIKEVLEKINQDKANMLSHSDQIFDNAEYLYSLPDYGGDEHVYRWNYFYSPVKIGDNILGVRIAVRDMAAPAESQIYNWGIKKSPTLDDAKLLPQSGGVPGAVSSDGENSASLDGVGDGFSRKPNGISSEVSDDISSNTSIPSGGENVNGNFTTAAGGKTARTSPVDTLLGAAGINTQPAPQNVSEAGNSSIQTAQSGENVNVDYTAAANEAFNAATAQQERLDNIAGEISAALGVPYYPGKQKSVSSIISRLSRNEARGKGNDWHTLKDLARTHIEMNSWEDIPKVLSMLDEMKIPYTASAKSTDFGYKGFHIVWYENGVGHELQLSTPEAWAVKQKSEEIYAKWRDATAEPDFVPTAEFDKDVAESIAMFNQLNLPDFSSFATSSGVSNRASSSKSSPNNIGERSEPQPPSANSENGLPGSYLITRPESVNVTPTDNPSNSNNVMSSMDIIQNLPQTVNGNFTTAEGGERYRSNLGAGKGKTRRSQTVETIAEAKITADAPPMFAAERREQLNSYVQNGRFDYIPDTNEAQTKRAKRAISEKGWSQAVQDFHDAVNSGKASKDLVAQGAVLLNNATNSGASGGEYLDLASDYIELLHRAGEILQAGKILLQLTPEGRLYCMQKTVKRINNSLTKGQHKAIAKAREGKNYKNIKEAADDYGVTLDESLATAYLDAKTDEQRDAVISQIQQNIADQIPSTFADKWNAMRYVNMLGNFKTQARNLIGNSAMFVTQTAKNRVKAAAEVTANLFRAEDNKMERTAVFWVNGELLKQAAADFDNIRDIARGEGKYNDTRKFAKEIEDKRTILKVNGEWGKTADSSFAKAGLRKAADVGMSVLDGYRKLTNWAMDAGDVIFLKATYADALGGWMKAHGIKSIADATPEQLERGRAYAIKEAQEATFRDDNAVSKAVTSIGRNPITEGIIPFRKTPANVAVRALEYSPVGVAETIYKGIQTKKGDATANDVINSLSKNIMGSLLSAAGYVLAKAGFARGNEDDEELDNFQKMQGKQDYAIKIGNEWVSLSQLAPVSVPLFMGVKLYELLDGGSLSLDDATKILGCLNDPLMDMSMLSGVNDALSDAVSYGNDADMFWKVLANAMLSYLTQGINNSLIGQIEQATEKNRQTIYTDKNSPLPSNVQRKIGQAAAKIPGVDYHQQDYVDAWGRTQSNGGRGKRIFDAIINPFYSSTDSTSEVDAELERIHKAGTNVDGFPEVLPDKAKRSMEYIKGMTMTPEEYKQYSIDRGTKSLELVTDFMQSKEYKSLTDQQRAEVISDLYGLAANQAINKVKATNGVDYSEIEKLKGISDEDAPEYLAVKQVLSDAKNGKTKAWDSVDMLLAGIKDYSPEVQKKLQSDSGLHVNKLLYADDKGIDTEEWFKAYDAIGENIEANGGSDADWVIAEAIGKLGGSDADKLNTLQSFNTPEKEKNGDGYKRNGAVRRYDAAINSGFSYDEWTEVEKAISAAGGWSAAEKAKTPALEAAGFTAQEIKDIYAVHNASNKDSKVNYLDEYWQGLIDGTALKNSDTQTGKKIDTEYAMKMLGIA